MTSNLTSRRAYLKSCLKSCLNLSLGSLAADSGLSMLGKSPRTSHAQTPNAPILFTVYCQGGWDPTLMFDPKPENAAISLDPTTTPNILPSGLVIGSSPSRPNVDAFFAAHGEDALILNGIYAESMSHDQANSRVFGGFDPSAQSFVDWRNIYAETVSPSGPMSVIGLDTPYLPNHLARLSLRLTGDQLERYLALSLSQLPQPAEAALQTYLRSEYTALTTSTTTTGLARAKEASLASAQSFQRALALTLQQATENAAPEDSSALSAFQTRARMGLQLCAAGTTKCFSLRYGDWQAFDTHQLHFPSQSPLIDSLFSELTELLHYATSLSLENNLILLVVSEMGKSPALNDALGKDHWPYTSMLLWGKSLKGGTNIGLTDNRGVGLAINPVSGLPDSAVVSQRLTFAHVYAALMLRWGVDYVPYVREGLAPLTAILRPQA